MQESHEQLAAVARTAAQAGAHAIQKVLAAGKFRIEAKSASYDLVTDADWAAESAVLAVLREQRPDDAILAEESGVHAGTSGIRWLVDPLDGTANFVLRRREFAVSVAAERDGVFLAAAVHCPADDRWAAGGGTHVAGSAGPMSCSPTTDLRHAIVGVGYPYPLHWRVRAHGLVGSLITEIRDFRRTGSAVWELLAVAAGELDAYIGFGLAEWDLAAGRALVPAAGGRCEDLVTADGIPVFAAGTANVVDRLVALLAAESTTG